eukprot:GHRQ01034952.1.p1 GENE.GHRQ01034952.1~~GHRQ01034952.1.p1  ORF type:complete len:172 (-),score=10.82 GHRQ01034952.1:13-528(-)
MVTCCPWYPVEADVSASSAVHTCGSIMRGQRRVLLMMMALSMLSESLGRPSSSQLRMVTGSPSTPTSLKLALHGIDADLRQHVQRSQEAQHVHQRHVRACTTMVASPIPTINWPCLDECNYFQGYSGTPTAPAHLQRSTHWLMALSLYAAVNGPKYAMQPADNSTSPVRCV